ncbi:MAG: hypothetical protein CUN49_05985 [Candidatus Thermofonsia Clade 1 bacterium]|uniref:Uncharacterized protein n=1 Tax=Candidatus Thermofonsia Clade 1 bacterium TaxID=2364210 RepID=A0A2M8PFI8_9CHLR|nr:MAG: hypothetical protein CUN49_05985 [Candidatus Thermofonsia Clade 1 bacterium]
MPMIEYFLRQLIYPTLNPLYQLNTRHFCPTRLHRDARLMLIGGIGAAAAWWLLVMLTSGTEDSDVYLNVLAMLALASLMATLAADVFYVMEAVKVVQQELAQGTWDLLRLSHLPAQSIASAKYALAQLRAWRVIALEFAIRAAVLTLIVLPFVRTGISLALTLTITGVILASLYWLEVWWRARAVISLSLLSALLFNKPINAMIVAALSAIGLHVAQAAFLATCGILLLLALQSAFTLSFLCGMPLCALAATGGTFFFYERAAAMTLQRFVKRIGSAAA